MSIGKIRLSKFGQAYFLYKKGTNQYPSSFSMNHKAFNLKPDEAFYLVDQIQPEIGMVKLTESDSEEKSKAIMPINEPGITKFLPETIDGKQVVINFNGAVTINFNR